MVDGRKSGIVKRIRCKTVKRRIGGGKGQRDCQKMNRYRGYQWKVLRKGDVTSWTEINEVWNRGHHKLRTTSRFLVRRCHNHIHSPTLVVYHFLLLPLPLCITISFSHVSCLFISVAFFFSTSIGVSHTHHWYPLQTEAVTNPWIHWMNTVCLRAQPWLDIVCIIFMLMHRAQFLCRWDEWYRHTFFFCFFFCLLTAPLSLFRAEGTYMCVFIQTMLHIHYLCQDPAFLFISIELWSLTNTSHICICLKKEKSSQICPFLHQKFRGLCWGWDPSSVRVCWKYVQ